MLRSVGCKNCEAQRCVPLGSDRETANLRQPAVRTCHVRFYIRVKFRNQTPRNRDIDSENRRAWGMMTEDVLVHMCKEDWFEYRSYRLCCICSSLHICLGLFSCTPLDINEEHIAMVLYLFGKLRLYAMQCLADLMQIGIFGVVVAHQELCFQELPRVPVNIYSIDPFIIVVTFNRWKLQHDPALFSGCY